MAGGRDLNGVCTTDCLCRIDSGFFCGSVGAISTCITLTFFSWSSKEGVGGAELFFVRCAGSSKRERCFVVPEVETDFNQDHGEVEKIEEENEI